MSRMLAAVGNPSNNKVGVGGEGRGRDEVGDVWGPSNDSMGYWCMHLFDLDVAGGKYIHTACIPYIRSIPAVYARIHPPAWLLVNSVAGVLILRRLMG